MPARQLRWTTGDRTAVSAKLLFSCTAFTHVWRKVGNQILFEYVIDDDYVGCKHFSVIGADKIEWYRGFFLAVPTLGEKSQLLGITNCFFSWLQWQKFYHFYPWVHPPPLSPLLCPVSQLLSPTKRRLLLWRRTLQRVIKRKGRGREGGRRETRFHA